MVLLPLLLAGRTPLHAEQAGAPAQVLNLAPVAFQPANDASHYIIREGGLGQLCSTKSADYFVAPLALEDGAVIERITALVQDKNKDSFALLSLLRRTPESLELLAVTGLSSGSQGLETLSSDSIATPVIDNRHYSYLLQLVLTGPEVCLAGAQVTYRKASDAILARTPRQ
jgi:hypothetical protein